MLIARDEEQQSTTDYLTRSIKARFTSRGRVTPARRRIGGRLLADRIGGGGNEQTRQLESATSKRLKSKLGLPDLDHSKAVVLDSLLSPECKRGYRTRDR